MKLKSLSQERVRHHYDDKVNLKTFPSIALLTVLPSTALWTVWSTRSKSRRKNRHVGLRAQSSKSYLGPELTPIMTMI